MKLPTAFDPEAVRIASILVRYELSAARFDHLPAEARASVVETGVTKLMAAGAFVRNGALCIPPGGAEKLMA